MTSYGCDGVSNHQPRDCLLNCLFRRRSKKTSKLRVTGLGEGNSPGTSELSAQRASNAENVSIWWCHQVLRSQICTCHASYQRLEQNEFHESLYTISKMGPCYWGTVLTKSNFSIGWNIEMLALGRWPINIKLCWSQNCGLLKTTLWIICPWLRDSKSH